MDDPFVLFVVVLFPLLLIFMYYMYNNRKISLSCPKPPVPPACPFTDYLQTRTNPCYNLGYNGNYPLAANYAFDTSKSSTPAIAIAISQTTPKDSNGNLIKPTGGWVKDVAETEALHNTLRLQSPIMHCGAWCIYNAKTKDAWGWTPDNTIPERGVWIRLPYATSANSGCFSPSVTLNGAILDNVALKYKYIDEAGLNVMANPSYVRKYWV